MSEPPPSPWHRWCTSGNHWAPTRLAGDNRKWTTNRCPDCANSRKRELYATNPRTDGPSQRARRKERYATDPEYREVIKGRARAYYAAHTEEVKTRVTARARTTEGKAFIASARATRAAHGRQAECDHGDKCWGDGWIAMQSSKLRCAVEGCDGSPLTADHIVPLSRGGLNCRWNIQPMCGKHNSSKHDSDPIEWQLRQGLSPHVQLRL